MTEQLIEDLRPFIQRITDLALPSIPGAGSRFYLEIEAIRCSAVSEICLSLLLRTERKHGDEVADSLRLELEPIRESLLKKYPDLFGLMDPATWPSLGAIH